MINTDGLVDKLQVCSQSPSVSHAFLGQVWPPLNSATVAEGGGGPAAPARDQFLTNARPPSPLYSRCKTKAAQKSPSSKELCHTNAPGSSAKVVTVPLPKGRPRAGSQVVNKSESGMTGEKTRTPREERLLLSPLGGRVFKCPGCISPKFKNVPTRQQCNREGHLLTRLGRGMADTPGDFPEVCLSLVSPGCSRSSRQQVHGTKVVERETPILAAFWGVSAVEAARWPQGWGPCHSV